MESIAGEIVGHIHITICQTSEGDNFYDMHTDNVETLPFLDVIENALLNS